MMKKFLAFILCANLMTAAFAQSAFTVSPSFISGNEVMLLGQNVNSYGKGLENGISFAELLEEVCKVEGIERVRFMTSHPKDLSDELIETMAKNPKICRHLHLPLQSGSDDILKKMNRRYTPEEYKLLFDNL